MPQLDTLRTLAVAMVICSHWTGYHNYKWIDTFWFNGEIGVQLFFVLSGYLITGILLDERERAEELGLTVRGVLKAFYIRRFLRIFPIFYATLLVTYALGHPDVRQSIQWHIPYLSNIYFAWRGEYLGDVSHFWSLAVEEQFYIFWPFTMLLLPKRILLPFIVAIIITAPVFRYVAAQVFEWNEVTVNVLPFSSVDSLGLGALLALLQRKKEYNITRSAFLKFLPLISLTVITLYTSLHTIIPVPDGFEFEYQFLARAMLAPALAGIIWICANRVKGVLGKILELPPLIYLGKISYGLYILHFFIPGLTAWLLHAMNITLDVYVLLVLNICILVAVSSISWFFFEKKINDLKKYFPYIKRTEAKAFTSIS
jgi:peptidoglycan/LPS O-acetylase OafA/YrhL